MIYNYEPYVTIEEINNVVQCLNLGIADPSTIRNTELFFNNIFGTNTALCNSGTSALHLALLISGVGPGDEVICPDLTFASTWNVVEYVGARLVLVDIDKDTWCIDTKQVKEKLTEKTKAMISVDLFGNSCDYEEIKKICNSNNLTLVQDAAESLGTTYDGKSVINQGDLSCTSFNLNKIITSCGGGAIFSNDIEKIDTAKHYINQCKIDNTYNYSGVGYNYRMGAINAAILKPQLSRINEILQVKNSINQIYRNNLENFVFQIPTKNCKVNNWINVIKCESVKHRSLIYDKLINSGFEAKLPFVNGTDVNWIKRKYNYGVCKNSQSLSQNCIVLPSSLNLKAQEIEKICKLIKES